MRPQRLLDRAADILEERGWRKTDWGTADGPVCAWGAISEAATGKPEYAWSAIPPADRDGYEGALRLMAGRIDHPSIALGAPDSLDRESRCEVLGDQIAGWQDEDEVQLADVLAVMRKPE